MPRLDVRDVPPAQRHPRIKTMFEDMDSGETLELVNDHEPKPLFYGAVARRPQPQRASEASE